MAGASDGEFLQSAAVFLGAAVVAAPLFKRLQLGSVLGYIAAGVLIGPQVLKLAADETAIHSVAEFGVVLLLFVIGLELKPERLWRLRMEIFGLGAAQVLITALAIGGIGYSIGIWGLDLQWREAFVAGAGLALSSTAFAIQILREKAALATPYGDRSFAILLFQDLAIVPLIAMVSILAATLPNATADTAQEPLWWSILTAVAAIGAVYFAGRYGLKPVFRIIAQAKSDETFTAAALLVVVGAALAMHAVGLSMAMGAFLAGVLLAETEFRHQLETDIEPFRGLLMGLFFMAVGMSLNLTDVAAYLGWIVLGVILLVALKMAILFGLARITGSDHADSLRIAAVLSQGGEFGFVLFTQAVSAGLLGAADASLLNATVILSMASTPFVVLLADRVAKRVAGAEDNGDISPHRQEAEGAVAAALSLTQTQIGTDNPETPPEGAIIIAGFGRTGQVVGRMLRMRGYDVTLIDNNPRRIRIAETFGSRVYFGDARRPDTLATAGADDARAIFLCIDDRDGARVAIERIRGRFPKLTIYASTYDRFSQVEMEKAGAHVVERETFESALSLTKKALVDFGDAEIVDDLEEEFRRRDVQLQKLQAEFGAQGALAKLREGYTLD
jgi:monovalent cation:proton antiporter-2 (CPA2) family protein